MKNVFFIFMVLWGLDLNAATTIEMEGKTFDCQIKSGEIFHCEKNGHKVLVIKNFMGYVAVEKKADGRPRNAWVTKVVDNNIVLFELPKYPGSGMEGGMYGFKRPESKSERMMEAKTVIANLKDYKDDWALEFVAFSKKLLASHSLIKSKIQIKDYNGDQFNCSPGESRPLTSEEKRFQTQYEATLGCNYYACINQKGERALGFIPPLGEYLGSPNFLKLNSENSQLRFDGFKVIDSELSEDIPLYDTPPTPKIDVDQANKPYIDQNLFIPKKYQKNESTFNYLTNAMNSDSSGEQEQYCAGDNDVSKMIVEKKSIAAKMKDDLATTELSHYLAMTDGRLMSFFIDAAKSSGLGCRYDNMILSPEAAKHLDYLKKAKPHPVQSYLSITEVQELFKKAKNMSDIPFGYKYDGCYARAHVMARRFEEMGVATEKAWIKGSLSVPGTDIQWNYHVAPVINVKNEKGEMQKYVIDPSLNDKAVTLDEWVGTMKKNVSGAVMRTTYPFPMNAANFQRTAVALSSSDIYIPDNNELRSEEENMASAVQTMKDYTEILNEGSK